MNLELLERGDLPTVLFLTLPRVYIANKLPITIKLIDSLNTFKSHLKTFFFFPMPTISQVLLFRMIMHCKFWCFCLLFFFTFHFFSSACEFRFIERIGAHGKQNPDFIIIIFIINYLTFITRSSIFFAVSNVIFLPVVYQMF